MTLSSAETENSFKVCTRNVPKGVLSKNIADFSPCPSDIRDMSPFNRCYDATEVETISL